MEQRNRRHPFEISAVDRNVTIVILFSLVLTGLSVYHWWGFFTEVVISVEEALQYGLIREVATNVIALTGTYYLYARKTEGWMMLTAVLTLSVIGTLRFVAMAALSVAGIDVLGGLGDSGQLQSIITTMLFGTTLPAVPLYLLLRRDMRESFGIGRPIMRGTLAVAVLFALFEVALYFVDAPSY